MIALIFGQLGLSILRYKNSLYNLHTKRSLSAQAPHTSGTTPNSAKWCKQFKSVLLVLWKFTSSSCVRFLKSSSSSWSQGSNSWIRHKLMNTKPNLKEMDGSTKNITIWSERSLQLGMALALKGLVSSWKCLTRQYSSFWRTKGTNKEPSKKLRSFCASLTMIGWEGAASLWKKLMVPLRAI